MIIALTIHLLAALVWVGGMIFAHAMLRPAAAATLQPPERLSLWVAVFARFFPWVWAAVVLLPASGYWMILYVFGGFGGAGLYIQIMHIAGWVMIAVFMHVYFAPYQRLKSAVAAQDWPTGGASAGADSLPRRRQYPARPRRHRHRRQRGVLELG